MVIDGKTKLCGVIGNPVAHTLSPAIHNTLAEELHINLAYVPFYVEKGYLDAAIPGAYALDVLGINVTVPYKNDVIRSLKEIDPAAQAMESVNTLVRIDGGYKGYNTDLSGLYRAMCSDNVQIEGADVILLGAGGAARTVAFLCAMKGAKQLVILNRSIEKAENIAQEVQRKTGYDKITVKTLEQWKELPKKAYLVIQATSVGLHPNCDAAPIEDPAFYELVETGYDIIYRPAKTKFMQLVESKGKNAYNGLKMLVYQGVEAFEKWNNTEVSEEQAQHLYEKLVELV